MPFDQTTISNPRLFRDGDQLVIVWNSSAPAGTVFQVYIGRQLTWHGAARSCRVPWPQRPTTIDVGAVGAAEGPTSFAGSLASPVGTRAVLSWQGGTYLSESLDSFRIFGSTVPGGAVDYSRPLVTVPAYVQGVITDGFGMGEFSSGGFGQAAATYTWQSERLGNGLWTFAVVPIDAAGNPAGSPLTTAVMIAAGPRPPAADPTGARLRYTYAAGPPRVATLSWSASPA